MPHKWLSEQYRKKAAKNPRYSMRAFSKTLGIGSGRVSQLISGKRSMTRDVGEKIAAALKLSLQDKKQFIALIENTRITQRESVRRSHVRKLVKTDELRMNDLLPAQIKIIGDPLHFAILSLMETKNFKSDAGWIAKRLGHSDKVITTALQRMTKVDMISNDAGEFKLMTGGGLKTSSEIPSRVIRKAQKKIIAKMRSSVDEVEIAKRDITSIMLAIDPKKLPAAKELIKEFRRKLGTLLESGDRTEVYCLAVQLSPVSKIKG